MTFSQSPTQVAIIFFLKSLHIMWHSVNLGWSWDISLFAISGHHCYVDRYARQLFVAFCKQTQVESLKLVPIWGCLRTNWALKGGVAASYTQKVDDHASNRVVLGIQNNLSVSTFYHNILETTRIWAFPSFAAARVIQERR